MKQDAIYQVNSSQFLRAQKILDLFQRLNPILAENECKYAFFYKIEFFYGLLNWHWYLEMWYSHIFLIRLAEYIVSVLKACDSYMYFKIKCENYLL